MLVKPTTGPLLRLGLVLVLALAAPGTAAAAIYTVTNTNDSGPGSLRQALADADGFPGGTVAFSIGTGVKTIRPLSGGLGVAGTVIVDGTTQPGYAGTPLIQIDGSLLPAGYTCMGFGWSSVVRAVVINNCPNAGIYLQGDAKVVSSFIGTDPTGQFARPNGIGVIVQNSSYRPTVGGTSPGEGNLISGNNYGIWAQGLALIVGNRIGTNAAGTAAVPNFTGIFVYFSSATGTLIGGPFPGFGNLISGNNAYGIDISGVNDVTIQGNTIGPDALGQGSLPSQLAGVHISTGSRTIVGGGAGANVIAFNGTGVSIDGTSVRNPISRNAIFGNGLGIDLVGGVGPGVTPNDPCDADTGPNLLLNFPVLTQATQIGSQVRIDGTLNSEPDALYTLEFFTSPSCNASGNGEGKTYIGSMLVATDSSCNGTFSGLFMASLAPGSVVTATSTDVFSDTSEFSACAPVTAGPTPSFYTVQPCRVVDTRDVDGPYGGPALNDGADRTFLLAGQCGIPPTATAVSLNVAVTQPTAGPGFLTMRPGVSDLPQAATINYKSGQTRANNAIMPLGGPGSVTIYCQQGSGTAHVVVDVNGYFQ